VFSLRLSVPVISFRKRIAVDAQMQMFAVMTSLYKQALVIQGRPDRVPEGSKIFAWDAYSCSQCYILFSKYGSYFGTPYILIDHHYND
jgi:hypothetical protein